MMRSLFKKSFEDPSKLFLIFSFLCSFVTGVTLLQAALESSKHLGTAVAPLQFSVGSFCFERPPSWQWITPTSPMRQAELAVPNSQSKGAPAEVTFFHFGPNQGGSVQANCDRWARQFSLSEGAIPKPKIEHQKAGTTEITFVSIEGTFASGMPGGPTEPRKEYALCGAILESSQGDVYVKMTGPKALVKEATPIFHQMVIKACKHSPNQ